MLLQQLILSNFNTKQELLSSLHLSYMLYTSQALFFPSNIISVIIFYWVCYQQATFFCKPFQWKLDKSQLQPQVDCVLAQRPQMGELKRGSNADVLGSFSVCIPSISHC